MTATMGQNLTSSLEALQTLILNEVDPVRMGDLEARQKALRDQLQRLIDEEVPKDTVAYKKANLEMAACVTALKQAIADQTKLADAITMVAKGVDVVAKLAGKVV